MLLALVLASVAGTPSINRVPVAVPADNSNFNSLNSSTKANPLCIDNLPSIQLALKVVGSQTICLPSVLVANPSPAINSGQFIITGLPDVVHVARLNSPSIQSAIYSYDSAIFSNKYSWRTAIGFQISLSPFVPQWQGVSENYYDPSNKTSTQDYSYKTLNSGISASLNILDLPSIFSAKASDSSRLSQASVANASTLQTLTSAANSFIELWLYKQLLSISQANIKYAIQALNATVGQYQVGLLAIPDVAQVLTQLRSYQANYSDNVNSYNTSLATFCSQLGVSPDLVFIPDQLPTVEGVNVPFPLSIADTKKQAILLNDTIREYIQTSSQYANLSKSALSNYLPQVTASASASGYNQHYTLNQTDYGRRTTSEESNNLLKYRTWQATVNISWLLFDTLANKSLADSYNSKKDSYQQLALQQYQNIDSTADQYYSAYLSALNTTKLNQSALEAASKSYQETLIASQAGFSNTTALVQVLQQVASAQQSVAQSLASLYTSNSNLQSLTKSGVYKDSLPVSVNYSEKAIQDLRSQF
jgi:outer membrane protein TolC